MNQQINLRLHPKLLTDAKREADKRGHRNVQGFIEELLRNEIYDNIVLTPRGNAKLAASLAQTPSRDEAALWDALRKASGRGKSTHK